MLCPCGSGADYQDCCAPLHRQKAAAQTAEQLMRSRYAAYVAHEIDYLVATTVPSQQALLDREGMAQWSRQAEWLGLDVLRHTDNLKPNHAQVAFVAHFAEQGQERRHEELSAFVRVDGRWYFIDPTVPLPPMKQLCICGSGRKFKACCGQFFR